RGPAEGGRDPWLPSRDRAPRERTEVAEDRGSGDHPCHYPLRGSRRPVRRTVADGDVDAAEVGEMDFSSCADRLIQSIAWTSPRPEGRCPPGASARSAPSTATAPSVRWCGS